jgi:hypothetical protein
MTPYLSENVLSGVIIAGLGIGGVLHLARRNPRGAIGVRWIPWVCLGGGPAIGFLMAVIDSQVTPRPPIDSVAMCASTILLGTGVGCFTALFSGVTLFLWHACHQQSPG